MNTENKITLDVAFEEYLELAWNRGTRQPVDMIIGPLRRIAVLSELMFEGNSYAPGWRGRATFQELHLVGRRKTIIDPTAELRLSELRKALGYTDGNNASWHDLIAEVRRNTARLAEVRKAVG